MSYSLIDLGSTPDPADMATNPPNPGRARCEALFKGRTGSAPVSSAYRVCDSLELLRTALAGATAVTPASLLAGVDKLGNSFSIADGYLNARFGPPSGYDGASATRVMQWDEAGKRWRFVSPSQTVP